MIIEARLCREFDGQTQWTPSAVQSLIGQAPAVRGYEATTCLITAAWLADGWVVATLDIADR